MERRRNGKLRLLYVRDILARSDAPEKAVTLADIVRILELKGVCAERKCLYDDLRQLERYGMKIARTNAGRYSRYYVMR